MPTTDRTRAVQALTESLIERRSVTPEDAGCQDLLAERLQALGFQIEYLNAGSVRNLWAKREFGAGAHLMFAGHTDVVPTGPLEAWSSDPFQPTIRDGHLYGRGAADMKASLAAMVVAVEAAASTGLGGTLSFLVTSDEEGEAIYGTRHAVKVLSERGEQPDFCVVGEPSSSARIGDVVRCGRRGSLNAEITLRGVQGHVAYPQDARNPIHQALPALAELTRTEWDQGNDYYPATSFQISNINAGTGATNVIPGELKLLCNFRYNTEQTAEGLQHRVEQTLQAHDLDFSAQWQLSGPPFLTERGRLTDAVVEAVQSECGYAPELSTSGGTSDGRFIAPWDNIHAVEVVELGPINATIHKIDERVALDDLAPLTNMYQKICTTLLKA